MSLTKAQKAALKDAFKAGGPAYLQSLRHEGEYIHSLVTLKSLVKRSMLAIEMGEATHRYAYSLTPYGERVCIEMGIGE